METDCSGYYDHYYYYFYLFFTNQRVGVRGDIQVLFVSEYFHRSPLIKGALIKSYISQCHFEAEEAPQ